MNLNRNCGNCLKRGNLSPADAQRIAAEHGSDWTKHRWGGYCLAVRDFVPRKRSACSAYESKDGDGGDDASG